MDSIGIWLVIGAAIVIAVICLILLQKKGQEAKKYLDELKSLRNEFERNNEEAVKAARNVGAEAEAHMAKIDELTAALESLKQQNSQLHGELEKTRAMQQQSEEAHKEKETELVELTRQFEEQSLRAAEAAKLNDDIASLNKALAEKTQEVARISQNFEEQMEEVVESSIQKINHAEQAKEEAIQAAQDNFEAAAEANARLKELEAQIKRLQGN